MSQVIFRHKLETNYKMNNAKNFVKEYIVDGPLGISISFSKKIGDEYYRIDCKENIEKNVIVIKEKKNNNLTQQEIPMAEFMKLISKNKDFLFVSNYMNDRSKYKTNTSSTTVKKIKSTTDKSKSTAHRSSSLKR